MKTRDNHANRTKVNCVRDLGKAVSETPVTQSSDAASQSAVSGLVETASQSTVLRSSEAASQNLLSRSKEKPARFRIRAGSGAALRSGKLQQAVAALLITAALLAGCSGESGQSSNAANELAAPQGMADNAAGSKEKADDSAKAPAEGQGTAAADKNQASPAAASAQPRTAGSTGSGMGDASDAISRKLIYKANIAMEVKSYDDAQTEIQNLITLNGGYMLVFSENQTQNEKSGNFTIKVPANGFSTFLADLAKIGHLKLQRSVQGQDVTEEYVDLSSRLKGKEVEEARLLAFMEKAMQADDLVTFSNQLGKVQEEIEKIKGRMRFIDQNVSLSTIELRLYEKMNGATVKSENESPESAFTRAGNALKGSARFIGDLFEGLFVFLAGALPILLVLAIVGVPAIYGYMKTQKNNPQRRKSAYGEKIEPSHRGPGATDKAPDDKEDDA
ncbi:DUF4349 domain-containing protein [Paenibacillus contaminans]|uniref:DUF4349 domain-containing protein n=1 Tax=Paenibacillus contaminans TaxID=450362 RepID=A0A329MJP3_9BACL|nr:DUF4349 domain-containing protein [Paenibacillus contaminans]RAV19798.1 DUF4349 domain-containing protein [Paenibacillus contaminans]